MLSLRRLQAILVARFIVDLRYAENPEDSSDLAPLSLYTMPVFVVPSLRRPTSVSDFSFHVEEP